MTCVECKMEFSSGLKLCRLCDGLPMLSGYVMKRRSGYSSYSRPKMVCYKCSEDHKQNHIVSELEGNDE